MAKRVGQVRSNGSRVIFKRVNRVAGQSGHGSSWVKFTHIFKTSFFFFEIDVISQLFISSLTVIRLSLVILFPITTKHLIPKLGETFVPDF